MLVDSYRLALLLAFQAPVICLLICTYIFVTISRNGLTRKQLIYFRMYSVGCIAGMVCEVLNGLMMYGALDRNISWVKIICLLGYITMLFNAVSISEFCMKWTYKPKKVLRYAVRSMYLIVTLLILARIIFYNTRLFIFENENNELSYGPLDDLQTYAVLLIYLLMWIMLLFKLLDKKEFVYREKYKKSFISISIVMVVGIAYALTFMPYIIWMGNMVTLLYLYVGTQGMVIYGDELTGLSNRRRMLKDIAEKMRAEDSWGYIMSDVNDFKQINDRFGHKEGDRALTLLANAIEEVALQNRAKAYRIGGDEFAFVCDEAEEEKMEILCEAINERMIELAREQHLKYKLVVSFGYAIYDGKMDVQEIMEVADQRMYIDKKQRKLKRVS